MLQNVRVERLDYHLERVAGLSEAHRRELEQRLPPPDNLLCFDLRGSSTAMASAIRRVSMAELLTACLGVDQEAVRTFSLAQPEMPDRNFIPAYFMLRLRHIQVPLDTEDTYRLEVRNTSRENPMVVYSGSLVSASGRELPFAKTHRLGMLAPMHALEVERITVERGHGYNGSHFYTTGKVAYATLDYRPVSFLGPNGRSDTVWVRTEDVLRRGLAKRLKPKGARELLALAPLFIPGHFRDRPEEIRENLDDWEDRRFVDEMPEAVTPMIVRCANFHLECRLAAVHDAGRHLERVFTTLIERFRGVLAQLGPRHLHIAAPQDGRGDCLTLVIEGEDDTMGQLLREKVFDLGEGCFVNCSVSSRRDRTLIVRLRHPDAEALLRRSFSACVADLEALLKQCGP
jgi:hypothetical protein